MYSNLWDTFCINIQILRGMNLYFRKEMKLHILHQTLVLNFVQDVSPVRKCLFCDITFERQHLHNL